MTMSKSLSVFAPAFFLTNLQANSCSSSRFPEKTLVISLFLFNVRSIEKSGLANVEISTISS